MGKACNNILHTSTNLQFLVLNVYLHPCHKYLWRGDVIMVIISFWIDWFYFQSLQQGLGGKSREKIIALLSENGKLIAASLAAKIEQGCPRIVLCSRNVLFRGIISRTWWVCRACEVQLNVNTISYINSLQKIRLRPIRNRRMRFWRLRKKMLGGLRLWWGWSWRWWW